MLQIMNQCRFPSVMYRLWIVGGVVLGLMIRHQVCAEELVTVSSLQELAETAAGDGRKVKMQPGVYRLADYLTDDVLKKIHAEVDRSQARPPVPMFVFSGNNNRFDFREVVFEIDTNLYAKLPGRSYIRCLIISGSGNHFSGLTIRNAGPQKGSGGNTLSVAGPDNTLEDVTLHVEGSFPYGYGDLFGKGGPNLLGLQKQSGIQVLGSRTLLRHCKVLSRAFGHCFYIQAGDDIRIEDCRAEGAMRATNAMLAETSGPAFDLGFRSVYLNRDGRYAMVPGYMKSLSEDGFRTYGGAGNVTLVNCVAVNTRAGFEIAGKDDAPRKSVIENCEARGCERGYLLGSNVVVRGSRGDLTHGPLLYLRGGVNSEVALELSGAQPISLVHAVATIAGSGHRVTLTAGAEVKELPALPVLFGFGMPAHGEMASPILPAATRDVTLECGIPQVPVVLSDELRGCSITSAGRQLKDADLRRSPGNW